MAKAKKTRKKDYSTIMIVNRDNPNTRALSVPTRQIHLLKYYLLAIVLALVGLTWAVIHYSGKAEQNATARLELDRFKKEIAGPMASDTNVARAYIMKIDRKLRRIQKYLKQRGVKGSNMNVGGIDNGSANGLDHYRSYNAFLTSLIGNIKHMPVGYPHDNKRHSSFGYRSNPFHGGGSEFHSGIDIQGDTGDPIKATADGVVVLAEWYEGYGNCVRIKHEHGYETLYGHLSKILVKNGQQIKAGTEIGKLGSTGRSTGPHLHYEVRFQGTPLNPADFLELN